MTRSREELYCEINTLRAYELRIACLKFLPSGDHSPNFDSATGLQPQAAID